jgi:hypothetical protein
VRKDEPKHEDFMTAFNAHSPAASMAGQPHTPGSHQFAAGDWTEIPETTLRKHLLGGSFFISKTAEAALARMSLSLDTVLFWFNQPRPHVRVGDSLSMGLGLEAFFGFDDAQVGARAFFVEISLHCSPTRH